MLSAGVVTAYAHHQGNKITERYSDLTRANIEALRADESPDEGYAYVKKESVDVGNGHITVTCICAGTGSLSCC